MSVIPHRSPDDPAFVVFDRTLFRVDHALFFLRVEPLRRAIGTLVEGRKGWNLEAAGLLSEDNRLRACLAWLEEVAGIGEDVVEPPFEHEPAIDVVAAGLITSGEFQRAACPACESLYSPDQIVREPWQETEEGVTITGHRSVCGRGHIIHATTDLVDVADLEGFEG